MISLSYFLLVCRKKKLYLRIGEGGSPIVCGKNEAKVFDEIKAQNVLDHLPKVLQKMNFVKEPVVQSELNISDEEEIPSKKTVIVTKTVVKNTSSNKKKKKIIKNTSYKAPQNVMSWVDRVAQCNDLFLDAEERRRELLDCLSNTDTVLYHGYPVEPTTKPENYIYQIKTTGDAFSGDYSEVMDMIKSIREVMDGNNFVEG